MFITGRIDDNINVVECYVVGAEPKVQIPVTIADDIEFTVPLTIDDPQILREIEKLFQDQTVGSF